MNTRLLRETSEDITEAAQIIREGGLVAFPTETVYGLGADALNADAVARIYEAKGRPNDNPTIVHISAESDMLRLTNTITDDMKKLMKAFWPGPMTMICTRKPVVPDVTTGGLDTVGIRMPSNPIARELIFRSGRPIAAPSANLSGRPSPTTAQHVIDDLDGKVDAIIQSGPCQVGIESTVIDMTQETPMILRPGILTQDDFEKVLEKTVLVDPTLNAKPTGNEDYQPKAPGMKYKHYAPKAEMIIFQGATPNVAEAIAREKVEREARGQKVSVIAFRDSESEKAAHEFFARLRQADKDGADVILAAALPQKDVGFSVMNRMLRSAGFNVREC
ncbi:MAG: threonylcarbamoyl-AMP synthase [Eubacterium sp.]|nr:threonylcarbamoyl-AMP synthase [Eubacterium sp.]